MIESITIKNFQSYKKAKLVFHKGVNVIVGDTDSGKSTIIRAIKLVTKNRPSGDDFISDFVDQSVVRNKKSKKSAIVKLNVDGNIIKRVKGKNNLYYLGKEKYKAFGQSVPDKISDILNISEINIQNQLDLPFLLCSNSGEVARYFNKIIKLDVIDRALKNIDNRLKSDNRSLSEYKKSKKRLEKRLEEYEWLDNADNELIKLERIKGSISKNKGLVSEIISIIKGIGELKKDRSKFHKLVKAKKSMNYLMRLKSDIENDKNEYQELFDILYNIKTIRRLSKIKKSELSKFKRKFKSLMPDICPLCGNEVIK